MNNDVPEVVSYSMAIIKVVIAGKLHEGKEIMQLNPSMVTFEAAH